VAVVSWVEEVTSDSVARNAIISNIGRTIQRREVFGPRGVMVVIRPDSIRLTEETIEEVEVFLKSGIYVENHQLNM
jgi:hypothetical protein